MSTSEAEKDAGSSTVTPTPPTSLLTTTPPTSALPSTSPTSSPKAVSVSSKIPPRSCFQTIVTIEVGAEKQAFLGHKDLLVYYSDYFRAAFNGSFVEASQGKISLADVDVDVFSVVNQFIYTRQLCDEEDSDTGWVLLVLVWIFGDKYLMPSLQNKVMDVLIAKNDKTKTIPTHHLKLIYNNTTHRSPLRKLVLDLVAYTVSDMDDFMKVNDVDKRWPYDGLVDLVRVLAARKKEDIGKKVLPEANKSKCYYHIHPDGEKC